MLLNQALRDVGDMGDIKGGDTQRDRLVLIGVGSHCKRWLMEFHTAQFDGERYGRCLDDRGLDSTNSSKACV